MKVRDLVAYAEGRGWTYSHTTGSHQIYKKRGYSVSIPGPMNHEVPSGTVRSIKKLIEEVG